MAPFCWAEVKPLPSEAEKACAQLGAFLRPVKNTKLYQQDVDLVSDESDDAVRACQVISEGQIQSAGTIVEWLRRQGWQAEPRMDSPAGAFVPLVKDDSLCRVSADWTDSPDTTIHPPLTVICSKNQKNPETLVRQTESRTIARLQNCVIGTYSTVDQQGSFICCPNGTHCD